MIITISGKAGSGKSTVAKKIAKELGLRHYSVGDLMRRMAKNRGISLLELSRLAEKNKSIDKELDEMQIELGKGKDGFVIDGRLTAYFITRADLKVFLYADEEVRARRIFNDTRGEESNLNFEITLKDIRRRESSERKRYMEYYKVDYGDKKLYDAVINTNNISVGEVVDRILNLAEKGLIKR